MKNLLLLVTMAVLTITACKSTKETVVDNGNQQLEQRRAGTPDGRNRGGGDRSGRMEQMFARMDANGDGQIAKSEAQGPFAERFDTIDTNKDGLITKEEMQNAPRPERGRRPGGGNF